jgi:hypothetical protein
MSSKHPHDYDWRLSGPGNNTRARKRERNSRHLTIMTPALWLLIEAYFDIRDCAVARQLFPLKLWQHGVVWWIRKLETRSVEIPYSEAEFRFMRQYTSYEFWTPRLQKMAEADPLCNMYHMSTVAISLAVWTLDRQFMHAASNIARRNGNITHVLDPTTLVKAVTTGSKMGRAPPGDFGLLHMGVGYIDFTRALIEHPESCQVIILLAQAEEWFWLTQMIRQCFVPRRLSTNPIWWKPCREAFFFLLQQKQIIALEIFVREMQSYLPGRIVRWCGLSHSLDTLKLSRQLAAGWRYTIRCRRWRSAHEDTTMWDTHWTHPSHINFFNQMRIYQQRIRDQRTRAAKRKRQQVQETTDKRSRLNENVAVAQG